MHTHATKEGTFSYLKNFKTYSKDFYRFDGHRFVSSIGLGTFRKEPYREENYVINYKESVKTAIKKGINLIDTAINYRYQVSEQEIGEALKELFDAKEITRESVVITSKAGFIPLEFPFPDPYEWIKEHIIDAKRAAPQEIVVDQHCMSEKFLRYSVERSLKNLGLDTIDIMFLHNPEMQLGYEPYDEVLSRIKAAFTLFETLVKEGKICHYAIASWNAFLYDPNHTEYISLKDIIDIAQEVGGEDHHFLYIQTPYNLGKTHAFSYANQIDSDGKYYTLMQLAHRYNIKLMTSSSLLQMNLFKGAFDKNIHDLLGTNNLTDVAAALQFARSSSTISALFGAVNPQHVEDNALLAYVPNASGKSIKTLYGAHNDL